MGPACPFRSKHINENSLENFPVDIGIKGLDWWVRWSESLRLGVAYVIGKEIREDIVEALYRR